MLKRSITGFQVAIHSDPFEYVEVDFGGTLSCQKWPHRIVTHYEYHSSCCNIQIGTWGIFGFVWMAYIIIQVCIVYYSTLLYLVIYDHLSTSSL